MYHLQVDHDQHILDLLEIVLNIVHVQFKPTATYQISLAPALTLLNPSSHAHPSTLPPTLLSTSTVA
jgi:hypothetical protein